MKLMERAWWRLNAAMGVTHGATWMSYVWWWVLLFVRNTVYLVMLVTSAEERGIRREIRAERLAEEAGSLVPPPALIGIGEAGVWLDRAWGWRNNYRVVDIAISYGFTLTEQERRDLAIYTDEPHLTIPEEVFAAVTDQGGLTDRATEFLNGHAPDGYTFVWGGGELSLMTTEEASYV